MVVDDLMGALAVLTSTDGNGGDDGVQQKQDIPLRDTYNTRRIVVTVTDTGKLIALDSADGRVIWRSWPRAGDVTSARLALLSSSSHAAVLVVKMEGAGWTQHEFDPVLGTVDGGGSLATALAAMGELQVGGHHSGYGANGSSSSSSSSSSSLSSSSPAKPSSDAHALVLVAATSLKITVLPVTAKASVKAMLGVTPLFLHAVDAETGLVQGYRVFDTDHAAESTWSIKFDPEVERIVAVASGRESSSSSSVHHGVASLGDALGDGRVLYKYLNPNVQAVATLSKYDRRAAKLRTYLIDTVKGRVLDKTEVEGARGPVHLVQVDNWACVHYRNRRAKRFELAVTQMYAASEKGVDKPFSSFDSAKPIILRQTFVSPYGATAMATTVTRRGIAEKLLLLGVPNGGIFGLPRQFIDVRRPKTQEEAKTAVKLPLYHPMLPFDSTKYVTQGQSVARLDGITSGASGLESTSAVFAHGLDLFFTQVAATQKFDVLPDTFSRIQLCAGLALLVGSAYILRGMAHKKRLNRAWK